MSLIKSVAFIYTQVGLGFSIDWMTGLDTDNCENKCSAVYFKILTLKTLTDILNNVLPVKRFFYFQHLNHKIF